MLDKRCFFAFTNDIKFEIWFNACNLTQQYKIVKQKKNDMKNVFKNHISSYISSIWFYFGEWIVIGKKKTDQTFLKLHELGYIIGSCWHNLWDITIYNIIKRSLLFVMAVHLPLNWHVVFPWILKAYRGHIY